MDNNPRTEPTRTDIAQAAGFCKGLSNHPNPVNLDSGDRRILDMAYRVLMQHATAMNHPAERPVAP